MRTLVIGGTGYLGSHVAERLDICGFEVTVLARGRTDCSLRRSIEVVVGDRHDGHDLRRLARQDFDAVVDINAYRREETEAAIAAFDGHTQRFVHISTLSVLAGCHDYPLREDAPLATDPAFGYAYDKAECERALRQAHARADFPFVVLRPGAVFGPRDRLSRENYFLKRLLAGEPIVLPDGGPGPVPAIFVRDVAEAVAAAIVSEDSCGVSYNLLMPERVRLSRHVRVIARCAGVEADIVSVPRSVLGAAGMNVALFPYDLGEDTDFAVDVGPMLHELGLRTTPYEDAIDETVRWFLERGPESLPAFEDRFPPVLPRRAVADLANEWRRRAGELEAEFAGRLRDRASGQGT